MARCRSFRRWRGPRRGGGRRLRELLERAYAAFNGRDIDGALELMHEDVDWPNGMEGGRVHGRDAVREYWERQFTQIDSHVSPLAFEELPGGRLSVTVDQRVRDLSGAVISEAEVRHVYAFRDGLISRMDID